ncbi:transporter substrate-binding domain-containing protein [Campylobacter ureolyticus]|uniref:Transporter substrate-binding domain-containing protein n=1 Tax=Campylobacter ureolyticus TaxID=827 RepID=A0A9Q4KRH3_9BACT|nr:transporter substrate-binding domain-containing protein [Campylobacter ureolyticus]MCZ6134346.1 transporter substrate-binding domain-containing protein [Campylobacter ureolyticus]MCZ6161389.1 transporter substrate-binding domain-containing protein [Campylobacter ureolyticus]MCZ6170327.1 transporter substrate-binding domain-containing protein [Campylobacter ureolyticus]
MVKWYENLYLEQKMKKIMSFFMVFFLANFLNAETPEHTKEAKPLATQEQPQAAQPKEQDQENKKVLIVGTNSNYKPFSYIGMSFEPIGFEIDLINAIAQKVGFEYEIKDMNFDKIISSIQDESIDIGLSSISITEERKALVDFSHPYFQTKTVYLKKANNDEIKDKESLNGKIVSAQKETVFEKIASSIEGAQIEPFNTPDVGIMNLKQNKVDAIILDLIVANDYLGKNKDLVKFFEEGDGTEGFGIAFAKGKNEALIAKINEALEELKSDGTYDNLLTKYHLK